MSDIKLSEQDRAEIIDAAYREFYKAQRGARGQTITEWSSAESYVIVETERRILAALEPAPTVTPEQAAKVLLDNERKLALAALASFHDASSQNNALNHTMTLLRLIALRAIAGDRT